MNNKINLKCLKYAFIFYNIGLFRLITPNLYILGQNSSRNASKLFVKNLTRFTPPDTCVFFRKTNKGSFIKLVTVVKLYQSYKTPLTKSIYLLYVFRKKKLVRVNIFMFWKHFFQVPKKEVKVAGLIKINTALEAVYINVLYCENRFWKYLEIRKL